MKILRIQITPDFHFTIFTYTQLESTLKLFTRIPKCKVFHYGHPFSSDESFNKQGDFSRGSFTPKITLANKKKV